MLSLSLLYQYILRQYRGNKFAASLLSGALFGTVAIFIMLTPFVYGPGLIYDSRSIILAAGALFGGPVIAGISASIAAVFRAFLGGSGTVAGIATIIESSLFGLLAYYLRAKGKLKLTVPVILALGLLVHVGMLVSQLFIPGGEWKTILPVIALPVLAFNTVGFLLVAELFLDAEERVVRAKELEESESRYRTTFEDSFSVKLLIDPDSGSIVDANKAAAHYYGWTKEELLSMKIMDINSLSTEKVCQNMAEAINTKNNVFCFKHRIKSGEERDVEVFSSPIEFYGKKLLYSIVHDVSDRIKAENTVIELNRTLEERVKSRTEALEDANRELEAFTYSVSHDLKAPLRAIDSFAAVLSEELPVEASEKVAHYLDRIHFNARKINSIIDNLLRLSRINNRQIERTRLDLTELARDICGELTASNQGRDVEVDIEDGLTADADRGLVRILLENLLGNAFKYTATKTKAHVRFGAVEEAGERAFAVEDDGVGFDMAHAEKLFAPFQRLHDEREFAGEGIGLSIARRIVVKHGGHIWAVSEPNKGAAFFFTLGK